MSFHDTELITTETCFIVQALGRIQQNFFWEIYAFKNKVIYSFKNKLERALGKKV